MAGVEIGSRKLNCVGNRCLQNTSRRNTIPVARAYRLRPSLSRYLAIAIIVSLSRLLSRDRDYYHVVHCTGIIAELAM